MAKVKVPEDIRAWHELVDREPNNFGKDIHDLKSLIERLLLSKTVYYDPTDVDAFIEFAALFQHREGRWSGQPVEFTIEQKYFAACVLGFKMWDDEIDMEVRYFREAVLFVARKWGKSLFISVLALYLLMADGEPSAQVWCLATQKSQAGIVYDNAKSMLRRSDVLTPPDHPRKYWRTKRDKDNAEMILFMPTESYMKAGSKNTNAQDGLNPHAFVIDEMHAIENRNTYDVFSSAVGARAQPLGIIISTFGFVREGIFDSVLDRCQKVLAGTSDERLFPMIFRIDDDDEPSDPTCWIKANPGNREGRPTMSYLKGEYQKALEDPAQMPSFLAKHLNRASGMSVIYFDLLDVNRCAVNMTLDMIQDKYAVGGVDMAETTDLCCATAIIPLGGRLHVFQKYFIARQRIEHNSKNDKMAYESFCSTNATDPLNKELLHICEGSMVKKGDVTQWYVELAEKYGVTFWKIGYDRWHGGDWVDDMEINGFPKEDKDGRGVTFPVAQGAKSLSAPMKETRSLFKDGVIAYDRHNGLFRWCVTNTAARVDVNSNIQPDKAKSRGRIDGYVSFLIAYVAYKREEDKFLEYQP
jgi:phage terminase large subunit-like protein